MSLFYTFCFVSWNLSIKMIEDSFRSPCSFCVNLTCFVYFMCIVPSLVLLKVWPFCWLKDKDTTSNIVLRTRIQRKKALTKVPLLQDRGFFVLKKIFCSWGKKIVHINSVKYIMLNLYVFMLNFIFSMFLWVIGLDIEQTIHTFLFITIIIAISLYKIKKRGLYVYVRFCFIYIYSFYKFFDLVI